MTATAARDRSARMARRQYLEWLERYLSRDRRLASRVIPAVRRELWRTRHPIADDILDRIDVMLRRLVRAVTGG